MFVCHRQTRETLWLFSFYSLGGSPEYRENGFGNSRPSRDNGGPARYSDDRYEDGGGGRYGGGEASARPGQRGGGFNNNPPGSGPPIVRGRVTTGVVVSGEGPQEGAVLMVYGLNMEKMNADRLFNLLCLYGNVFKVDQSAISFVADFQLILTCV